MSGQRIDPEHTHDMHCTMYHSHLVTSLTDIYYSANDMIDLGIHECNSIIQILFIRIFDLHLNMNAYFDHCLEKNQCQISYLYIWNKQTL